MLNYEVDRSLLAPLVPDGTVLDSFEGRYMMSVVGFMFVDTRLLGVPVPLHRNFEEVNLRFYVRRVVGDEVRRAVTFVRELVPRRAIAAVARFAYNEPYSAVTMGHDITAPRDGSTAPSRVEYRWRTGSRWCTLAIEPVGSGAVPTSDAEETFITEHYWGYTRQRDGSTIEYRVEHPRWRVWPAAKAELTGDLVATYGARFAAALDRAPDSAFLADGSEVRVHMPVRVPFERDSPHPAGRAERVT